VRPETLTGVITPATVKVSAMNSNSPPRPAPAMTHHKISGLACVRLGGRDFLFGSMGK
jgi:hypothetical protein